MSTYDTPEALGQPGILVQGTALRIAITRGIEAGLARWTDGYGTWRQADPANLADFLALYIAAEVAPVADQHTARVADKVAGQSADLLAAARAALPALCLLGDFIGNTFDGKVGTPAFDRCAVILELKRAIAVAEAAITEGRAS